MNKSEYCVTRDYTIAEVLQVFERNKERGVIVCEGEKVCGFLSMGDIIRALAQGKHIHSQIGQIYTSSFIYLKERDYHCALQIFKRRNISLLPIVDDDFQLIDIITPKEIFGMVELS